MNPMLSIQSGNSAQRNELIKQTLGQYPNAHIIIMDEGEEIYPEFGPQAFVQVQRNAQLAVVYADSIVVNPAGYESVAYRQPFDRNKIPSSNPLGGPYLVNNAVFAQWGPDLFDTNLSALADYEMLLRVSQNRISYHIPRVLSKTVAKPPLDPNLINNEANYVRSKLFGAQPQG